MTKSPRKVAVLISGRGSNMAALAEHADRFDPPWRICLVLANRPGAAGIRIADALGLPTAVVDHREFSSRQQFDAAVDERLTASGAEFVACAGYMRIMTAPFVERWCGRMINIHPSLLPAYKGLDTHARALADGVRIAGCSVHFVSAELDSGPIIAQAAVPVAADDTPESLAARVLTAEHRLYPACLDLLVSGKVRLHDGRVVTDEPPASSAILFSPPVASQKT